MRGVENAGGYPKRFSEPGYLLLVIRYQDKPGNF